MQVIVTFASMQGCTTLPNAGAGFAMVLGVWVKGTTDGIRGLRE
jgi:hypothetical protein